MKKIYDELFSGWTKNETVFGWSMIVVQFIFGNFNGNILWGMIAGIASTISVLLTAKGKISNYYFGFIQAGMMMLLVFQGGFSGAAAEHIFYLVAQFWGINEWKKNMNKEGTIVKIRKLTTIQSFLMFAAIVLVTYGVGKGYESIGTELYYVVALKLVVALFGQMLLVYRFREHWLLWGFLSVFSIYQWLFAGDIILVSLHVSFLVNTIYGFLSWNKQISSVQTEQEASTDSL